METTGCLQEGVPHTRAPVLQDISLQLSARLLRHPFLVRCNDGTITLEELHGFLVQQGKYSSYFTRYLCALISQLDDGADVLRLARNLAEELGYDNDARVPHARVYAAMLQRFGIALERQPIYPETQSLIDTMFMLCRQPGGVPGLGALCLGAEAVVPAVYRRIIEGFRSHSVAARELEFFSMHIDCDDDHAKTMYAMIEKTIDESPYNATRILNAGEIAINARLRFFDALLKEVQ